MCLKSCQSHKINAKTVGNYNFTLAKVLLGISKHNIETIASLAMFGSLNLEENLMEEDDEEEPTRASAILV